MAWTAPRTWVAGEVLTESLLNTHVRDNLNALSTHAHTGAAGDGALPAFAYKAAAETVNNSATLQNDDHLVLPIAANTRWIYDIYASITASGGAGGIKVAVTAPAGITAFLVLAELGISVADGGTAGYTDTSGAGISLTNGAGYAMQFVHCRIHVVTGGTAGNIQFQWAQSSAVASDLTLGINSFMTGVRVA